MTGERPVWRRWREFSESAVVHRPRSQETLYTKKRPISPISRVLGRPGYHICRLPELAWSKGIRYRGSSGDGSTRVDGEVWTISSHHQIDGKLLFCPAEGSPDPRCRREELSRATLKAESAAAALFSRRLARTTRLACEGSFLDAEANEPRKHAAGLLLSRSSGSRAALRRRRGLAPRSGRRRAPHHTTTATTTAATHAVFSCVEYGRRDCGALPRGAFSAARRRVLSVGAPRGGVGDGRRLCASALPRGAFSAAKTTRPL